MMAPQQFTSGFAYGFASYALASTVTAPFEKIKIILQVQKAHPQILSGELLRCEGIYDCGCRVVSEQGGWRLWDGNLVNCLRYIPKELHNLAFKDMLKSRLPKYSAKNQFWRYFWVNLLSGGLTQIGSLLIMYPLELARSRLASDIGPNPKSFSGGMDCMLKAASGPGGCRALYTGFGAAVVCILGYRSLQLSIFETITSVNPWRKERGFRGIVSSFVAEQSAILIGGLATHPFDLVRRRLMLQAGMPITEQMYKGTLDCFQQVIKREGWASLWQGFLATVLRNVGGNLCLCCMDIVCKRGKYARLQLQKGDGVKVQQTLYFHQGAKFVVKQGWTGVVTTINSVGHATVAFDNGMRRVVRNQDFQHLKIPELHVGDGVQVLQELYSAQGERYVVKKDWTGVVVKIRKQNGNASISFDNGPRRVVLKQDFRHMFVQELCAGNTVKVQRIFSPNQDDDFVVEKDWTGVVIQSTPSADAIIAFDQIYNNSAGGHSHITVLKKDFRHMCVQNSMAVQVTVVDDHVVGNSLAGLEVFRFSLADLEVPIITGRLGEMVELSCETMIHVTNVFSDGEALQYADGIADLNSITVEVVLPVSN